MHALHFRWQSGQIKDELYSQVRSGHLHKGGSILFPEHVMHCSAYPEHVMQSGEHSIFKKKNKIFILKIN